MKLPEIITFPEKTTYSTLTEAVSGFHQMTMDLLNAISWSDINSEAATDYVFYTLMAWSWESVANNAVKYQNGIAKVVTHLGETYTQLPEDILERIAWNVGKIVLRHTPVVCYYHDEYDSYFTERGYGFHNARWDSSLIDEELSFENQLKVIYAYDQYRVGVEVDLIMEYCRKELYLTRSISVNYTWQDEYDWRDFVLDLVELVVSPITTALEIIFYNELTLLASTVLFTFVVIPALVSTSTTLMTEFALEGSAVVDVATGQYLSVASFTTALSTEFSAFLEFIHWNTLVSAHNIALIVSEDYREIWANIQQEISKMSEALGLGPHYLNLIIRNTRTLVLDVSTAIGMKYDLAQVQWLSTFSEYSGILAARAYRYRDNPSLIITDLEEMVDRKLADSKGSFMSTVVSTVDSALVAIEGIANTTVTIRDDLDRLATQMPADMSAFIKGYTDPIIGKLDGFLLNVYGPDLDRLDKAIQVLSIAKTSLRNDLDSTNDRLKKPADYLLEIDGMTDAERLEQEDKLQEVTTRPLGRTIGDMEGLSEADKLALEKIQELLEREEELPAWYIGEEITPYRPSTVKAKPRETWFVGEF